MRQGWCYAVTAGIVGLALGAGALAQQPASEGHPSKWQANDKSLYDLVADGFKLYAIRPSSVFSRLGLANGDGVRAINGYELTSPDKALEMFTKLRAVAELTLDITRRGQPMMITVTID